MPDRSFTSDQIKAIEAEANVLVLAGAGTGKTRTLVERCVRRLLDPASRTSLSEMLLVTFTDAAAAEMKSRIRQRLELEGSPTLRGRIDQELAWLDRAHICTLHSFCLHLVREHFYELRLDPQINVLTEVQSRLLMEETLDALLRRHLAGRDQFANKLQEFMQLHGEGADRSIHSLIFKLHAYAQTRENPEKWLCAQESACEGEEPEQWKRWFLEAVESWRARWLPRLETQPAANFRAHEFAQRLIAPIETAAAAQSILNSICAADSDWNGMKKKFRRPISAFFDEAAFLGSLIGAGGDWAPLEQDWTWMREPVQTLLQVLRGFSAEFSRRKRDEAALDFHDFEQFALQLLWGRDRSGLTPLAEAYRRKFKWIMVDEYQDINPSQDAILRALSREGAEGNRFLVGDVKQSIYRFRLADPYIFQAYRRRWHSGQEPGTVVPLSENFRSRESLLAFANTVFSSLMRSDIGGVDYDAQAQLRFARTPQREPLSLAQAPEPSVELDLLLKEKKPAEAEEAQDDDELAPAGDGALAFAELNGAEREARLVAGKLQELREAKYMVWNREQDRFEPVDWKDMVILLRAPSQKADVYAQAFNEMGIPFQAQHGGFYDSMEVRDITSVLAVLDNPLNDVPTLAVLRSPMVGLSLNELAVIRMANAREAFWLALKRWHEIAEARPESRDNTFAKINQFLQQFSRWRQLARERTISQRLETILNDTHYLEWLLTQDRAPQRHANVQRFLALAQQFDPFQRLGLQRFLRFVEMQKEAEHEREPLPLENPNAVRLMSIHQSKGLEFPIVVVPDLAKRFNFQDMHQRIIVDEEFGLCAKVQPPGVSATYPSLPYWMAQRRQKPELLGEELRLLYVAFTRAQDRLILVGTASPGQVQTKWSEPVIPGEEASKLLAARSYLDWLGPLLCARANPAEWRDQSKGNTDLFTWEIHRSPDPYSRPTNRPPSGGFAADSAASVIDPLRLQQLIKRLGWEYEHRAATSTPAKQNATALSQLARYNTTDDAQQMFGFVSNPAVRQGRSRGRLRKGKDISAADIGTACHRVLHFLPLAAFQSIESLQAEAEKMERSGILSPEERCCVDFEGLFSFWQSDLGQKMLANSQSIHREIPFTARFAPADLRSLQIPVEPGLRDEEFLVVRGAVDLAVILPKEMWLVDFKTDGISESDLPNAQRQYASQLKIYSLALARIYCRPVTELYLHFLALRRSVRLEPALPDVN